VGDRSKGRKQNGHNLNISLAVELLVERKRKKRKTKEKHMKNGIKGRGRKSGKLQGGGGVSGMTNIGLARLSVQQEEDAEVGKRGEREK